MPSIDKPSRTTEEIVKELKQGRDCEENFRLLFERYYGQIHRFFLRKGMTPEDSRELTQETFFSVYKGLRHLRQESQFESWLYKIALNTYRSEIEQRQAKKRDVRLVPLEEEASPSEETRPTVVQAIDPGASPEKVTLEKEKLEKLHEAVRQLPEQMRRCTLLRVVNELSHQEIASIMGISVGTVKAHLHQARKVLREKLSPYFGEVEI
ncbi:MAG: sigma-70 family RNA polymerase sigma factor [Acidobacteria bacterium]|nr:sigma-70 family RNA polymerase sigma factor [Acidobacteriota bacterium]